VPDAGDVARLIRDSAVSGARQAALDVAFFDRFRQRGGDQATLVNGLFVDGEWAEDSTDGVLPLGVPPGLS
jgi:hypothetical protein